MANEHAGHRSRLRKQFLKNGFDGMYPHQILELLLFYVIPLRDTNGLAHALIDRFGSLGKVFDADVDEIASVPGIGMNTARFLKSVVGIYSEYGHQDSVGRIVIDNIFSADAYYGTILRKSDGEQLGITLLDDDFSVVSTEKVAIDDFKLQSRYAARKIVEALSNSSCRRCIIGHYRPSDAMFGEKDRQAVEELIAAAKRMNVTVENYYLIFNDFITALKVRKE